MPAISDLISRLSDSATTLQEKVFARQLKLTEEYLEGQTEIRILVGDSANFGHQSSSINIMRSLIALGVEARFTIALWSPGNIGPLRQKIAMLLPQFRAMDTDFQVDGRTVKVIDLSNHPNLDRAPLGLTGGWDAHRGLRDDELNVSNYVQLQPYGWTQGDYLIVKRIGGNQHQIDLGDYDLHLTRRGFRLPDPEPSKAEWTAITKSAWKTKAKVTRLLANYVDNGLLHLWPMYGIKTLGQSHCNMINALSGLIEAQERGIAGARRPTVVPVLQALQPAEWTSFQQWVLAYSDGSPAFNDWRDRVQLGARVKTIAMASQVTKENVTLELSKLKNNEFLFVNMGSGLDQMETARGLPTAVFNYLMGKATLPPVFEGQNTVELLLNLGRPYMKLSRQDDIRFSYPSLPITAGGNSPEAAQAHDNAYYGLQGTPPMVWSRNNQDRLFPPTRNMRFVQAYLTGRGNQNAMADYFGDLGDFYHGQFNDKLLLVLNCLVNEIGPGVQQIGRVAADGGQLVAPAPVDAASTLQKLYENLQKEIKDGAVNLLQTQVPGLVVDFFNGVAGSVFEIDDAGVEINDDKTKVTLSGQTTALGEVGQVGVDFAFTLNKDKQVETAFGASFDQFDWSLDSAPWLGLSHPNLKVSFTQGATIPVQGHLAATVSAGVDADITIDLPSDDNRMVLQADFSGSKTAPSITGLAQLIGGVDLSVILPSQIAALSDLAVAGLQLGYSPKAKRLDSINVQLASKGPWHLIPAVEIEGLHINVDITDPTVLKSREIAFVIGGEFAIGDSKDPDHRPGTVSIDARLPQLSVVGGLTADSPPIALVDVIAAYVGELPSPVKADVDTLAFRYISQSSTWSFEVNVDSDLDITIAKKKLFTIDQLGLAVSHDADGTDGTFSGATTVLPEDPDVAAQLAVSAAYHKAGGWTFVGTQTSGQVPLLKLVTFYLPDGWKPAPEHTYGIDGLGLTIHSKDGSFTLSGKTAEPWQTPLDGLKLQAKMTVGYKKSAPPTLLDADGTPIRQIDAAARSLVPVHNTRALTVLEEGKTGYFGLLEVDFNWKGVDLTVFYDFEPEVQKFGVQWGKFNALIEDNAKGEKVAVLSLKGMTLGGLVEEMVSWATDGQRYSLSAPWNALDSVDLGVFELTFNFKTNKVAFNLDVGPIELGLATIKKIGLDYDSKAKKVNVTLDGTFLWKDDKDEPLGWDATDPSSAPAPTGGGNKYLDLRVLAMGQHVTVVEEGEQFKNVEDVVNTIRGLKKTKKGLIPVNPDGPTGGQPGYDPQNSWFTAIDFGVLKVDEAKKKDASTGALVEADKKPTYFMQLAIVFDDPRLYALRIALDGPAAKMLAGLDFEVMYQQVSDTVGVYRAQIALPDVMRHLQFGAYSITLPVFGIAVYTNGDFQIDVGFPWDEDFSRSFTVEAIVYPGIPLLGSAGFYFGKLSNDTADGIPKATNGTFNPVIVAGFGMQVGLGKSIEYGVLSGGISLTVAAIVEGILARWHEFPHESDGPQQQNADLQQNYYFWLRGTAGIIGRLYGKVDFAVVTASVNVDLKLLAQITFESYAPIPVSVIASVDVSASISINAGLFKIKLSFSFSARIKETFSIGEAKTPPWTVAEDSKGRLGLPAHRRLFAHRAQHGLLRIATVTPKWDNLKKKDAKTPLAGHVAPALTVAGDAAGTPADQDACYVLVSTLEAPAPTPNDLDTAALKASGGATDTAFEALCKQVFRWAVAAVQDGPVEPDEVDDLVISDDELKALHDYLNADDNPTPIPAAAIDDFLSGQFALTLSAPDPSDGSEAQAAFFPLAPALGLKVDAYGEDYKGYDYTLAGFNETDADFLGELRAYFDKLAVSVESEEKRQARLNALADGDDHGPSVASFIFADYFLLLMRQMIQSARTGLRDFKWDFPADDNKSVDDLVGWINDNRGLDHCESDCEPYTCADLFVANADHPLNEGTALRIVGASYPAGAGGTFDSVAKNKLFAGGFSPTDLAAANASRSGVLVAGQTMADSTSGKSYRVRGGDSLRDVAKGLGLDVNDLWTSTDVLSRPGLLEASAMLDLPGFSYSTEAGSTLAGVAARYGIQAEDLGEGNGGLVDLFSKSTTTLNVPHLPQFRVGELIKEAQRTHALQNLSSMASRYYMHGLRLPTAQIKPLEEGMFVQDDNGTLTLPAEAGLYGLTGQQFPLPALADADFTFSLNRNAVSWLSFAGDDADELSFTLAPSSTDAKRLAAVRDYATKSRLDTGVSGLGAAPLMESQPRRFNLQSVVQVDAATPMALPYGQAPAGKPSLLMWSLPDTLVNLPDLKARAVNPRVKPQLGHYDEASAEMVRRDVQHYGWSTQVNFTVKRVDADAASPASQDTYELLGAGQEDITLLARLLAEVGADDSRIAQVMLAYSTGSSKDTTGRLIAGGASTVMGISQVNLSTETHPPASAEASLVEPDGVEGGLLGKATAFVRRLWEASITRTGGFYLYYYDGEAKRGLPSAAFNSDGEATLTMVVVHARPKSNTPEDDNRLHNYVNTLLVGEDVDVSQVAAFATSDPTPTTLSTASETTLADYAYAHFMSASALGADNPTLTLAADQELQIRSGVYRVASAAPGGRLADIAAYFAVAESAVENVNPHITDWSTPLAAGRAIRLPELTVPAGESTGDTLASLASFYGTPARAIAADNPKLCFGAGQTLAIAGGPDSQTATVPAGVVAIEAARPMPAPVPDKPDAPDFAKLLLQNNFSMLAYEVSSNQDFAASGPGLPAGPTTTHDRERSRGKLRVPLALAAGDTWQYKLSVPYARLEGPEAPANIEGLPDPAQSPYRHIGDLLQPEFSWNDVFGNKMLSDLGAPDAGAANRAPELLGYTDELLGVGRWTQVATDYQIAPADAEAAAQLVIRLSFDPKRFLPDDARDASAPPAWQRAAEHARQLYERVYYQLRDPRGVQFAVRSTLTNADITLGEDQAEAIKKWVEAIYTFVAAQAQGGGAQTPSETLEVRADLADASLRSDQLFELRSALVLARRRALVAPDLKGVDGVSETATWLAPMTGPLTSPPTDHGAHPQSSRKLEAFAASFEEALSTAKVLRKVAVGASRANVTNADATNTLWAVTLGRDYGDGISYRVDNPGQPSIFAPRPLSNKLQSRTDVPIYDYKTGEGIDFETPDRRTNFSDVDLDVWARTFVSAVDGVLTAPFVVAAQILDEFNHTHLLDELLDHKKTLAGAFKRLMIPVYKGEDADRTPAQDAFEQQLLVALSNVYSVRAAVQFDADVTANIPPGPHTDTPPRLYGEVTHSSDDADAVRLTSPKLSLQPSTSDDERPLTFLLSAPDSPSSDTVVRSAIKLEARYEGSNIEHQIGSLPGIEGYQASAWLSFVTPLGDQSPLAADLGSFDVPLVLRAFPQTPRMVGQTGVGEASDSNGLQKVCLWDYGFVYSQSFHYPQDKVDCRVDFNISDGQLQHYTAQVDLFGALAEFVTVFPEVDADLRGVLRQVDATTDDPKLLAEAAAAFESFVELVGRVADHAEQGITGLARPLEEVGAGASYEFSVREGHTSVTAPNGEEIDALLVEIDNEAPSWIGPPTVDIDGWTPREHEGDDAYAYNYVYVDSDGVPLSALEGQMIAKRQVVLPGMNVLKYQDAWAGVHVTRNQDLVVGKNTADSFVYYSPRVRFANSMRPKLDTSEPIDVGAIGSPRRRSVTAHLTSLFQALLGEKGGPPVTVQLTAKYSHSINAQLEAVRLPVSLVPPTTVDPIITELTDDGTRPLPDLLASAGSAIEQWLAHYAASPDKGVVHMDLAFMSNLTSQPMPLLRLRGLYLSVDDIDSTPR
jgi:hypothetical protein